MYIELFGLPGSGKTTLASALEKAGAGFARARNKEHSRAFRYMLFHPLVTAYWFFVTLSETAKSGTWRLLRAKLSLLYYTFAFLHKASQASRGTAGIMVVDEGLVQRMLSIFETKKDVRALGRALRFTPKPALYILVSGNPELYFKRYEGEGEGNIRAKLGSEYQQQWQDVVRHNHSVILEVLKETNESDVIDYSWQDDSLDEITACIKARTKDN